MSKDHKKAIKIISVAIFMIFITEMARSAPIEAVGRTKLSWEHTTSPRPERAPWSDALMILAEETFHGFFQAKDFPEFCPRWNALSHKNKLIAISELVIAVTYYESGYSPTSRMVEVGLGNDPYTGAQVASEGLLQLSYGDKRWAPWCDFNWQKDKHLPLKQRSILDPVKNLNCGVRIMANQIARNDAIVISKNAYWSVLKRGHRNQKINQIKARVKLRAPGCA